MDNGESMECKQNPLRFLKQTGSFVAVILFLATGCLAQLKTESQEPKTYPGQTDQVRAEDAWEAQQRKAMAKKFNQQRQQEIQKDTEKLLELATELKHAVDKSDENTLSLDVIKKAEQIEKLAKQVKEKMKGP